MPGGSPGRLRCFAPYLSHSLSAGAAQEQANADGAKTSGLLGLLWEARFAIRRWRILCDEQCAGA
ncbi:hypothetical protein DP120_14830 [Planococcus halotolerans]|uniref:Uncharacterized protein n=1 Tax=Planococcus halotolerans TaxID=2233542 RepID=A0A365KN94_9BACL|nr:hypothetical protein DP120_14830 [Planococcus halotolerans]